MGIDIRVGNLVQIGRFGSRVIFGVNMIDNEVTFYVNRNPKTENISGLSGIPISDKILNFNYGNPYRKLFWKLNSPNLRIKKNSDIYVLYKGKNIILENLKYVHELQNILVDLGFKSEAQQIIII